TRIFPIKGLSPTYFHQWDWMILTLWPALHPTTQSKHYVTKQMKRNGVAYLVRLRLWSETRCSGAMTGSSRRSASLWASTHEKLTVPNYRITSHITGSTDAAN